MLLRHRFSYPNMAMYHSVIFIVTIHPNLDQTIAVTMSWFVADNTTY